MATTVNRRIKIKQKIRSKISGSPACPRISVFRSNKSIYAQIIDDLTGVTLVSASNKDITTTGSKVDIAKSVGMKLAADAITKGLNTVVFDRSGYLYHGRIKSLAEGAREGGLKF